MDMKNVEFTEKELHCLARIIQSEESAYDTKCLYCRYAFECREEFFQNKNAPFVPVLKKIERITGVNISMNQETRQKEILAGSWIENCPELLERFNSMSLHEQVVFLKSHDCLEYEHQGKWGRGYDGNKKIISKQTEDEFVALVIRFANDNGMTASNVKEGMLRVARHFEDNALLGIEDSNR